MSLNNHGQPAVRKLTVGKVFIRAFHIVTNDLLTLKTYEDTRCRVWTVLLTYSNMLTQRLTTSRALPPNVNTGIVQ